MDLYNQIIAEYAELTTEDFNPIKGKILLKDDGDGIQYIAKWNYSQPLPETLTSYMRGN